MYSFSEYDEYGRITKINYDYSDSGYKYYNSDYKYNGKIVTNIIEYENNDTRYSQINETEYYWLNNILLTIALTHYAIF